MSTHNDKNLIQEDDDEGKGGKSGDIDFRYRDAFQEETRDDLLPASEIRRLLIVHKDVHKERVTKQKLTRKQRAELKAGKYVAPEAQGRLGQSGGGHSL